MRLVLAVTGLLLLAGCRATVRDPELGPQQLPFAGKVGTMAKEWTPDGMKIHLQFNVYGETANVVCGLDGSTNMANWYELTNLPAASTVDVIFYNRPAEREFYRAFTRWVWE